MSKAQTITVTGQVVNPDNSTVSRDDNHSVCLSPQFECSGEGCGTCEPVQDNGFFTLYLGGGGEYSVEVSPGSDSPFTGNVPYNVNVTGTSVDIGVVLLTYPSLTGYVTTPDQSARLSNVNVELRSADYTKNFFENSDDQGVFKFGGVEAGDYNLEVRPADDSGYAEAEYGVTITDPNVLQDMGAVPVGAVNVEGRIVDPDGNAMTFENNCWGNVDMYNEDHSTNKYTNTDTDGYFRFGTAPTGTYSLEVRASAECGYANAVAQTISVTQNVLLNVGDVRLSKPQVTGTVYDTDGTTPLRNVWVQVHDEEWTVEQGGNTDETGKYQIGGLTPGDYLIQAQKPWDRADLISIDDQPITVTSDTTTVDLVFTAATKFLSGQVTYQDGAPVTNAQINANKMGGGSWANTDVDQDGRYNLALSGGVWEVRVESSWDPEGTDPVDWIYDDPSLMVEFADDSSTQNLTQDFSVKKATATVIGRAEKPDGSPLTDGHVDVRDDEGKGNGQPINHDGSFSIRVTQGSYRLSIWTNDNSITFSEKSISLAENQTLDVGTIVAKEKNGRIAGTVTTKDGTPLGGVSLNAWKHEGEGWSQTTSEDDGSFVLAVDAGRWGINVDQGGGSSTRYVYDGEPVDVDVPTDDAIITGITMALTYADANIHGYVVDSAGDVVHGFCSWAFAKPVTTTTVFGPGMEYGAPVDCQSGEFNVYVPTSIGTIFTLGIHTPPNSDWLPLAEQNVAVLADATVENNIVVQAPNAWVTGQIYDQNGDALTSCTNPDGHHFGDVNIEKEGSWRHTPINDDCTYRISTLAGSDYFIHYWIQRGLGFMDTHPDPDPFDIPEGTTTKNISVNKADATLTGYVMDPDGNPADAGVWCGNWIEREEKEEGPSEEDMKNELHSWSDTNPADGSYTVYLLSGHRYMCGTGVPPESNLLPGEEQEIDLLTATSATANFTLEKALGSMSGTVSIGGGGGVPINHGFCWGWKQEGGHTGGEVQYGGSYSINYSAGTWHFGCDSFDGRKFYRSQEITVVITDQTSISQDFNLDESLFYVPSAVSMTFDAGNTQVITLENGTTINIPSGAMGESGVNVTVNATPVIDMYNTKQDQVFGVGYRLEAFDADDTAITSFTSPVTTKFVYDEEVLAEYGLSEDSLTSKYLNEENSTYQNVDGGCSVDKENNAISCKTTHFTKFAVVGSAGQGYGTAATGAQNLVVTPMSKGGPQVAIWDKDGNLQGTWFAYSSDLRMGLTTEVADLDGDGNYEVITNPGEGFDAQLRIFDSSGNVQRQFYAYDQGFRKGINIVAYDLDGDGNKEIITSPAKEASADIKVFSKDGDLIARFNAYGSGYNEGALIAALDLNNDGTGEIVTAPVTGSGQLRVFTKDGDTVTQFNAYGSGYRNGIASLVLSDLNGDDTGEIVTTPATGGSQIRTFDRNGNALAQFNAYASTFAGGSRVSVGDVDGDGTLDIVALPNSNGSAQARVFTKDGDVKSQFFAYPPETTRNGQFNSVIADVDGDGTSEIVFGTGVDLGPNVRIFDQNGNALSQFMALHPGFRGGVNLNAMAQ